MKKVSIGILIVLVALLTLSGIALAADPLTGGTGNAKPFTFWEASNTPAGAGYNSAIPTTPQFATAGTPAGASYWSYSDAYDGLRKTEGSYRGYDAQGTQQYTATSTHQNDGLYDPTGNDCKTCRAVHRATGTFYLMRVDSPNEACSYCHVGDHRHADIQAYSNGDGTIYPRNGHTIGAGKLIPDSSTWQYSETETLTATGDDLSNDGRIDQAISARRYETTKNKIFKWSVDYDGNYVRTGPTYLTCMSCHQPHNAQNLVWKPNSTYTDGFMLLRADPSGSIRDAGTTTSNPGHSAMSAWTGGYTGTEDLALKAAEGTLSAANTGWGLTGYTQWKGTGANASISIDEETLSVWCANCHNLELGAATAVAPNWRSVQHSDRTHPVPMVDPDTIDCASCHLSYDDGDFPHSGDAGSTKLLGVDYNVVESGVWDPVANEHLNQVCLECHDQVGLSY